MWKILVSPIVICVYTVLEDEFFRLVCKYYMGKRMQVAVVSWRSKKKEASTQSVL